MAILGACEILRDRFLMALLAETGIPIGQALGLRHSDFVSRSKEMHIGAAYQGRPEYGCLPGYWIGPPIKASGRRTLVTVSGHCEVGGRASIVRGPNRRIV